MPEARFSPSPVYGVCSGAVWYIDADGGRLTTASNGGTGGIWPFVPPRRANLPVGPMARSTGFCNRWNSLPLFNFRCGKVHPLSVYDRGGVCSPARWWWVRVPGEGTVPSPRLRQAHASCLAHALGGNKRGPSRAGPLAVDVCSSCDSFSCLQLSCTPPAAICVSAACTTAAAATAIRFAAVRPPRPAEGQRLAFSASTARTVSRRGHVEAVEVAGRSVPLLLSSASSLIVRRRGIHPRPE